MGVRERVGTCLEIAPVAGGFSDWRKEDTVCSIVFCACAEVYPAKDK